MSQEYDDFDDDFEDDEILTCTVCGLEADEDRVDQDWVAFIRYNSYVEALVCHRCSESEEKLRKAFEAFLKDLGAKKRETMT